ncbi:MAG: hypothetical protein EOP09_00140 [Proteobacteria bacterium]|nr:MAG: hypothetical protein EOP09_00140 [Pseudomonadota bacterium]
MKDPDNDSPYFSHTPTLSEFFGWEAVELRRKGVSLNGHDEQFFCLREILFLNLVPGAVSSDGSDVNQLFTELFRNFMEPIQTGNAAYFSEFSLLLEEVRQHLKKAFAAPSNVEKWLILARKRFMDRHGNVPSRREGKQLALRLMASFWLRSQNPTEEAIQREIGEIKARNLNWTKAFNSLGWDEGANKRGRPRKNSAKPIENRPRK